MSAHIPTLILADAHLKGRADPNQTAMVRFLKHAPHDMGRLVILGDFFDYLAGNNRSAIESYTPILDCLAKIETLHYVEGNHDFDLSDKTPGLEKAYIYPGSASLRLGGTKCHLLHGDRSSRFDLGTRLLRAMLQSWGIRFLRDRLLPDEFVFRLALDFAQLSRRHSWPGRSGESNAVLSRARSRLTNGDFDMVLFGHTHEALLHKTAWGILANPGEAVLGGTYLMLADHVIRLHRFPTGEVLKEQALTSPDTES